MNTSEAAPRASSKLRTVSLWLLQILLAIAFLMTAASKLIGEESQVALFTELGFGQWLRYVTGVLQIAGAIGLLIPLLSWLAAAGLAAVMAGAVVTEVFLLADGNAVAPAVLLLLAAAVYWGRRSDAAALRDRLTGRPATASSGSSQPR